MSKSIRLGSLLAFVLALLTTAMTGTTAVAGPNDPPKPGRVVGIVVTGEAGSPTRVADANVALIVRDKVFARTKTNDKGEFSFDRVPPGRHEIRAEKRDVGAGKDPAPVKPTETTRTRIILRKPK
jgi:hypothetical protein